MPLPRFICPFPAGGIIDALTRAMAAELSTVLNRPVIVEVHAGGNGALAAHRLRAAQADGNTWMMATLGTTVAQAMRPEFFPPDGDLAGLALVAYDIPVIVVPRNLPAQDLPHLLALARQAPDAFSYLRTGPGSLSHLVIELMKRARGVELQAVDYRGLPPGIIDLLAGRIQLGVLNVGLALPHLHSGQLRALAVVGPRRIPELPDLPTLGEWQIEDANIAGWAMVVLRADTPPDAVAWAAAAFQEVFARIGLRQALRRLHLLQAEAAGPADANTLLRAERRRYRALVDALSIREP